MHGASHQEQPWWTRWLRIKGFIGPGLLTALLIAAVLPLVLALSRIMAYPGAEPLPFVIPLLEQLGYVLNRWLSLEWVPASDRPTVLYLLLLPLAAVLLALVRLTLGLRVLGVRTILIAIGFQEAGFLPSLVLMAIVVGLIISIRPGMRRIRLPLFARILVMLCLAVIIMVMALIIAPWVQSEAVWSVAFFPVIIVAMFAEGVAKTVANDNAVTAAWRAGWTIIVAVIIALVSQAEPVRELAIRFPELVITQLVAIVLIAEFLDFRLLEPWPDRLHRRLQGVKPWFFDRPKIAVVRNRWNSGIIGRVDRPAPTKYRKRSVQRIVDALRALGYKARVFEGDMTLLKGLQDYIPPNPSNGKPGGLVLNLATGTQGQCRFAQVPAMLEMAGVAYTGPGPVELARLTDRLASLEMLREAGVPVPEFHRVSTHHKILEPTFPARVRARFEPDGDSFVVRDVESLALKVAELEAEYGEECVVESSVAGRAFRACVLGNRSLEFLPLIERRGKQRLCPTAMSPDLEDQVHQVVQNAYRALGCRDFARIDLTLTEKGLPVVTDVRCVGVLAARGSFTQAAQAAGYDFPTLLGRILEEASIRYQLPTIIAIDAETSPSRAIVPAAGHRS